MGSFLKRLIKPKTIVGKVAGAVGSILGIGGGGILADIDPTFAILAGVGVGAGYLFGWSKEQVKSFISFLNEENRKNK